VGRWHPRRGALGAPCHAPFCGWKALCVVPEFVSNGPFRVRIYVYRARAHTQNREQRENHKASLQSNLEFNSIVRRCTHRGRKCARGASPERPRDIHTHTGICVRFRVVFGTCVAQHRPGTTRRSTADRRHSRTQHSVRLKRVARLLACSNKIRTIAGEQLAAPPTINGSLRQSPFFRSSRRSQ